MSTSARHILRLRSYRDVCIERHDYEEAARVQALLRTCAFYVISYDMSAAYAAKYAQKGAA